MMPPSALTLDQIDRHLRGLTPGVCGGDWGVSAKSCRFSFTMNGRRCQAELNPSADGTGRLSLTTELGHVPFTAEGAVAREAAKTLLAELSAARNKVQLRTNPKGNIELFDERIIESPVTAEGLLQGVVEFVSGHRAWIQLLTTYLAESGKPKPRATRLV